MRAGDSDVVQGLRQNLSELSDRLSENGFHTETWRPAAAEVSTAASDNNNSSGQHFGGDSQQQQGWSQEGRGQRDQNQSNRPSLRFIGVRCSTEFDNGNHSDRRLTWPHQLVHSPALPRLHLRHPRVLQQVSGTTPPTEEMFLNPLVAQIQNQASPESHRMALSSSPELAQFSELEQVIGIRSDIELCRCPLPRRRRRITPAARQIKQELLRIKRPLTPRQTNQTGTNELDTQELLNMNTAITSALSGLNADATAINIIGNDLANLNTSGYKASDIEFQDLLSQSLGVGRQQLHSGSWTRSGRAQRSYAVYAGLHSDH